MCGNICYMHVFAECFPLVYAGGLPYFSFLETNKRGYKTRTDGMILGTGGSSQISIQIASLTSCATATFQQSS